MTQASLRTVTLKTVANYHHAAERAVGAYRVGGHRLIVAVRQGVDSAARRSAQRLAPRMVAVIQRAGERVGSFAAKGLDAVSDRTTRVLEIGSNGVRSQVERVAELAGGVDYPVVSNGLQAAVRFSLPGAQVALALSERVAAGAAKLESVAAGPRSTRAKAAAQRVRRAAKPGRTVAKAAAEVQADAKAVGRRTAKSVGKAAQAVSDAADAAAKAALPKVAPKAARKPVAKPTAQAIKAVKAAQADVAAATKPVRRAAKKAAAPIVDAAKDLADAVAA
jgi:hypothetical protein